MNKQETTKLLDSYNSRDLAEKYFFSKVEPKEISLPEYTKLIELIQKEISKAKNIQPELKMRSVIKLTAHIVYLTMESSIFREAQAITFQLDKNGIPTVIFIGGWANKENLAPIIKGFIKWCDWLHKEG